MENKLFRIDEIFAFIACDKEGEGIITVPDGSKEKILVPLIGADQARVDSFKEFAKNIGIRENIKVKLIKFITREEVETIFDPQKEK